MLIVHLGDIHIGAGRSWYSDLTSELPYYLARHKTMLTEILERLLEYKVTEVILAGDLFDSARPTAKEQQLLAWFLSALTENHLVHVIAGNHEVLHGSLTALHPARAYMTYQDRVKWHIDQAEITEESFGKVLWASFHATASITGLLDNSVDYVVGHYAAKGCVYASGMTATRGWDFNYRVGQVKQWFIGDIHVRQQVATNAWYSGSPLQLNFGESGSKGFDIFDTETLKREQVYLSTAAPLMTVRADKELPELLDGVLYRIYASRKFIDYAFPRNVLSVQLLDSKKASGADVTHQTVAEEIDFGDPLAGLEIVLERAKLAEELRPRATEEARELLKV